MKAKEKNSPTILVAFATLKDAKTLTKTHFGSADSYVLYQCDLSGYKYLKIIENSTKEERFHNDPVKATSVRELLQNHGVNVIVSKRFGPNITRVSKHFVPIIVKQDSIEEVINTVCSNVESIYQQWTNEPDQRTNILL